FVTFEDERVRRGEAGRWVRVTEARQGGTAEVVARQLDAAQAAGPRLTAVDASADFRFADAALYAKVYGHPHASSARLAEFTCALPEHVASVETPHAAHPGCFATSMLLGIVPLVGADLVDGELFVSAITGSTGAGRTPKDTTHHPMRHNNLFGYQALRHRHSPAVSALVEAATGRPIRLNFVPHSGPFARGIYTTMFARLKGGATLADARDAIESYYESAPFVAVTPEPPRLKDIVASNHAMLSVSADGDALVVHAAIDNLIKGAAGGSIQWVNRLLGLPETMGLTAPTPGWL